MYNAIVEYGDATTMVRNLGVIPYELGLLGVFM